MTYKAIILSSCCLPLFLLGTSMAEVETVSPCEVTLPNGQTPPGESAVPLYHGNGSLWTQLWSEGTVVFEPGGPGFILEDGSLSMKFPWWRGVGGSLEISGRRLDGQAPAARARIPTGYGDMGFQATSIVFPTEGCWEITGTVAGETLTFVTRVVRKGLSE